MSPTASHGESATPRSRALIAVPKPAPRRGILATCARAVVGILLLPVRLPVLAILSAARGVAWIGSGAGRAVAAVGRGLGRGTVLLVTGLARLVAAPFVALARLLAGLARLLAAALGGAARGGAWLGAAAGRGIAALFLLPVRIVVLLARFLALVLSGAARAVAWTGRGTFRAVAALMRGLVFVPVRIVVLLARLVALLLHLVARVLLFVLRIPFVALRLLGRGGVGAARGLAFLGAAIAVPAVALAWGAVRYVAAGVAVVVRGIATVLAVVGRLVLRGALATVRSLAVGVFVCVRETARLVLWTAFLPFLAARILTVALARGVRSVAVLLVDAAFTVGAGLAELVRGAAAFVRLCGRMIARVARPVGAGLATKEPQHAALPPLAMLAVLGGAEILGPGGFPFATLALLIVAAFASLALLSRPTNVVAVLLAWALAVTTGWRAEHVSLDTSAWLDALVYLSALAALRSAYVAARAFVREAPVAGRDAYQERAHRRASRAIGIVLATQCAAFALWSAAEGRLHDAPLYGELLLVGAGMALAWVVRSGQYVRTAQVVLSLGAIAALVGTIAAQFSAFAAGRLFTATSLGAGLLLLLVAGALTVVVHTRLIDTEHGA